MTGNTTGGTISDLKGMKVALRDTAAATNMAEGMVKDMEHTVKDMEDTVKDMEDTVKDMDMATEKEGTDSLESLGAITFHL